MKITDTELEKIIFQYVEDIKELLSPEIWDNILLDCTKNEMLILWLLYSKEEINMSQIAEYIHVPLNTATGIISRMEKRKLVLRERSIEDKRIVTIKLGEMGLSQMKSMMKEFAYYGMQITEAFSSEEIELFINMLKKLIEILKKKRQCDTGKKKVRKIVIQ